jgi:hypothetical protein
MFQPTCHLTSRLVVFVILLVASPVFAGFPDNLEPVLSIPLPGKIAGSIAVYPSFEKPEAIAVALDVGKALLLSAKGETIWSVQVGKAASAPLAVGDLDGDRAPEIIGVADSTEAFALARDGKVLWNYHVDGEVSAWRGPSCSDLDGDGKDEVIISDDSGWLTCLSGQGTLLWRMHADNFHAGQASIGDVDGDGKPDLVYGTENNRLVCLDGEGQLKWLHHAEGKFGRSLGALADLDGDGLPEAVWSKSFNTASPTVYAAHASNGSPFWNAPTILHGYGACSIADLDSDGDLEVVFGDRANTIYAYSGDGKEIWRNTTGGRGYMFPASIADVDGDGDLEVLAVCRNKNDQGKSFFILAGKTGKTLAEYPVPGQASVAPTVCDIDQDGKQELIFATPMEAKLEIFRLGAPGDAKAPWPAERGNPARTGYVPPIAHAKAAKAPLPEPAGLLALHPPKEVFWGENRITVDWPKALPARGFVDVTLADAGGVRVSRIVSIDPESPPNSLSLELVAPGAYEVAVSLWDESVTPAKALSKGKLSLRLDGIESLQSWVQGKLTEVQGAADKILEKRPDVARMLFEKAALSEGSLAGYARRAHAIEKGPFPQRAALADEIDLYKKSIDDLVVLARLAETTPHGSVAVWEDKNPWDNVPPLAEAPEKLDSTPTLDVWAFGGETEYRSLFVANFLPEPLDIQIRPLLGGPFSLREVVKTLTKNGNWVSDALPRMSQSHTLHIAPGEVRPVWFDIATRGLAPGIHKSSVTLIPIGSDQDQFKVAFNLEVAPVQLADTPEFPLCNWANPVTVQAMTDDPAAVKTVLDQGMTVWNGGGPGRSCNEKGDLVGKVDWSSLDKQIDLLDPTKAVFLMSGPSLSAPAGVERDSPVFQRGLQNAIREMEAHMASKGWPLDRWAYYPMDEPGLFGGVEEFSKIIRSAKEVCPEVQIYADPAGGMTRENFGPLTRDIDVWAPELAMLRRNADLVSFMLETQDTVWCYEAPGDAKALLPLGYYRAQCLTSVYMGFTGAGHWVFGYPGSGDLWIGRGGGEHGDMYYDGSALVQSRRWLGFMDGAEDARFLLLLKASAAECKRRGKNPPELAEMDTLLSDSLKHLIRKQWEQDDIARLLIEYEISLPELQELRKQTARLIVALRARAME